MVVVLGGGGPGGSRPGGSRPGGGGPDGGCPDTIYIYIYMMYFLCRSH